MIVYLLVVLHKVKDLRLSLCNRLGGQLFHVVTPARCVVILTHGLGGVRLDLDRFLLDFLLASEWFPTCANLLKHHVFEYHAPLFPSLIDMFQWFVISVKEVGWEHAQVAAIVQLRLHHEIWLIKVAVSVQNLMHLILDFGFQIEFTHHLRDHVTNLLGLGQSRLVDLLLDRFLNGPKGVRVLHLFEDELAFLFIVQADVGILVLCAGGHFLNIRLIELIVNRQKNI